MSGQIPYIDLEIDIDEKNIEKGCLKVLEKIRPAWAKDEIKFKTLSEGFVNTMMLCHLKHDGDKNDGIMFRIFGKSIESIVSRTSEFIGLQVGSVVDVGPRVLARFKNGICLGYLKGRTLEFKEMQDDKIMSLICKALARLHAVDVSKIDLVDYDGNPCQPEESFPWMDKMIKIMSDIQPYEKIEDEEHRNRIIKEFPPLDDLLNEYKYWKEEIGKLQFPVVLCHNDVHQKNTVYDEEKGELHFVDFEIYGNNYQSSEIAKFLDLKDYLYAFEMASEGEKDFDIDTFTVFMKKYLSEYYLIKKGDGSVSELDLRRAVMECQIYSMFQHLDFLLFSLYSIHNPVLKISTFQFAVIANRKYASCKDKLPKIIEEYKNLRRRLDDDEKN